MGLFDLLLDRAPLDEAASSLQLLKAFVANDLQSTPSARTWLLLFECELLDPPPPSFDELAAMAAKADIPALTSRVLQLKLKRQPIAAPLLADAAALSRSCPQVCPLRKILTRKDADLHLAYINALAAAGRGEDAFAQADDLSARCWTTPRSLFWYAESLERRGAPRGAVVAAFERALKYDDSKVHRWRYAAFLFGTGAIGRAKELFLESLSCSGGENSQALVAFSEFIDAVPPPPPPPHT